MLDPVLINLRQTIHRHPELSNKEYKTAARLQDFVQNYLPDEVIRLSNTGIAFVFNGKEPGKTTLFRAELDALPISETSQVSHKSLNEGVAHSCGHDGHMTIVAGLAMKISEERPAKGKVVLLFQPAEEIEQGARDVVEDPAFKQIEPDYIFALHNVPGIEKHRILLRQGTFAAASKGLTIRLHGKTSHAAEPENGISPANAIAKMITLLHKLIAAKETFKDLTLLTIIHVRLGEIAFGTSPGYAEIMVTLRAFENEDMALLTKKVEAIVHRVSKAEKLRCELFYNEVFPAVENDSACVNLIEQVAREHNMPFSYMEKPFKWSEDFSYYTQQYRGGFFGIGSGLNQPQLHHPDFDFPDDILETGITMFYGIYKKINF